MSLVLFAVMGLMGVPFVLIFIAFTAAMVILGIYSEKKRTDNLCNMADELGMDYAPGQDSQLLEKLQSFPTFNKGRSRKMKHVMKAATDDVQLAIFEYKYRTGSGKHSRNHHFTFAAMEHARLRFPHFSVRPEGFFDGVGSALGFQDIDFEEHPAFSDAFVLKGENELAIRGFFDSAVMDLFVSKPKAHVEAGGSLIALRKRGRIKPQKLGDFMADAYEFLNAFAAIEEGNSADGSRSS